MLLLLPGIPAMRVVLIAALLFGVGFMVHRRNKVVPADEAEDDVLAQGKAAEPDAYALLKVEPVEVLVDVALAPMVSGEHSLFMDRVAAIRKQYALETGMVLPRVRFRDSAKLRPNAYEVLIFGVLAGKGEIFSDKTLAIRGAGAARKSSPRVVSVGDVQKILQNLLREKVSIRNLELIMETLADMGRTSKDMGYLTELVRQRLGASICQSLLGDLAVLNVMTFDPAIEQRLMQSIRNAEPGAGLIVEPKFADSSWPRWWRRPRR